MARVEFEPEVHGNIFRVVHSFYTDNDEDNNGLRQFFLLVHNRSGEWVDVNVDRSMGVVSSGHIEDGQDGSIRESTQIYINRRNKITRWRPGVFRVPGNGGGEVFFNMPLHAFDIYIELEVVG